MLHVINQALHLWHCAAAGRDTKVHILIVSHQGDIEGHPFSHNRRGINTIQARTIEEHGLARPGYIGDDRAVWRKTGHQPQRHQHQARQLQHLQHQCGLIRLHTLKQGLTGVHGGLDRGKTLDGVFDISGQIGADSAHCIGRIDISLTAQGHRHHRFERLGGQFAMVLQVEPQPPSAHRQHRIIKSAIERLADRADTFEGPRLGDKTPGAVDRRVDRAAWHVQPWQRQCTALAHPPIGKALQCTVHMCPAVETLLESLGNIAQLPIAVSTRIPLRQPGAVALLRGH